jgi:DNA-binding beta-propeller fold protein YncE
VAVAPRVCAGVTGHLGRRSLLFPEPWEHAGGVGSRQWCGRPLVVGVATILLAGCGSGGSVVPGGAGSGWPTPTSTEAAAPTRPTAEELKTVSRPRGPVAQVAATIPLTGLALGIAMDPVTGKAFVLTCPGCGRVPRDDAQVIEVIDIATRGNVDEIPIPAHSAQIAVDPYAGVLYVSHTDERGEQIRTIDTTSHEVTGTIDVNAWGITVDPTTCTVYALEQDASVDRSTRIAVIDPQDGSVVRRIDVGVDALAGLTMDPVRGLLLVSDHNAGRLLVVDSAAGTVERTIQVVGWLADPCENCLGSIGTPVVDLTTGLAYLTGPADLAAHDPNPSQARGSSAAAIVLAGAAPTGVRVVPAGFGTSVLYVVDPAAGSVTQTVGVPFAAGFPTIDLSAGVVYLPVMDMPETGVITTSVLPVDMDSLALEDPIPVSAGSAGTMQLAVDPTTGQVWVAGDGAVTVLE